MASGTKYIPRISFDINEDLRSRIQSHIPWGTMRPLLTKMIEEVVLFIENVGTEHSNVVIAAIISGKISVVDILRKNEENRDT